MNIDANVLNKIKAIYDKPTATIVLNGENLKQLPLRSGRRQSCPLSPLLFKIVLEVFTTEIRDNTQNERKYLQMKQLTKG